MIFIAVIFLFYFINKPIIITAKGKGNEGEIIKPKPINTHKKQLPLLSFSNRSMDLRCLILMHRFSLLTTCFVFSIHLVLNNLLTTLILHYLHHLITHWHQFHEVHTEKIPDIFSFIIMVKALFQKGWFTSYNL